MKKIVVLGSINADLVTQIERTPLAGETVSGEGLMITAGGKGANQASAIGKLGGKVSMVGRVGGDAYGDMLLESLKGNCVDISHVGVDPSEPTGVALIAVNGEGDNTIIVVSGANQNVEAQMYTSLKEGGDYLLSQLELPLDVVTKSFEFAKKNGVCTVLNPAPAAILPDDLLKNVDILVPNEHEFELLTGVRTDDVHFESAAKTLLKKGISHIVITLGSKGVLHITEEMTCRFDAHKVKAIDTTAAGDSFIGGMLYYLSNVKDDVNEAIKFGISTAAITVTRRGAQVALPTLEEVLKLNQ